MLIPGGYFLNLIRSVHFDIANSANVPTYFVGKAILTAKNKDVKIINNLVLDYIPGQKISHVSNDQACNNENQMQMPVELLNAVDNSILPSHALNLRIGSPIMVVRNIDPAADVCNGTRLIVNSLGTNFIEAIIATATEGLSP